jgi:hypothetical protein
VLLAADMTADTRAWHSPVAVCGRLAAAAEAESEADAEAEAEADAEADTDADGETAGAAVGVCANGSPVLVTAGAEALTDAPPWTDPEPEKVPVVAASATPPVAKTASDAARTLAVRMREIGDLSICPLREVATGTR